MNEITEKQIDEAISRASNKISEEICDILIDSMKTCAREFDSEEMKPYAMYIGTMSASIRMSTKMTKEILKELLCD